MIEKKSLRVEEIKSKISEIIESISLVEENLPEDLDNFLSLNLTKDGIYKRVEFAIETIIDICNIINSDMRLGSPDTEESIIEHLETNKIFNKKIIGLIGEMRKFRNILVHRYGKIDDRKAFEEIKEGINDFELSIILVIGIKIVQNSRDR